MSKIRLYLPSSCIKKLIEIEDSDYHKLRDVLRLKRGEIVYIFDGQGKEFIFAVEEVKSKKIILRMLQLTREEKEVSLKITLCFPLMRENKIDFILQKATELGVNCFIPFFSQRCLIKDSFNREKRWERIIKEATQQSERLWLPKLEKVKSFSQILSLDSEIKLFTTFQGEWLKDLSFNREKKVIVVVGPEGDFSPSEIDKLKENNYRGIKLSVNLLRVETAAVFAVGLISYKFYEG
ncbi:MAG: 16S rRNA (uracil(1498)-N(3))-methyltransferase [Candidatus Omnitrophica bacterium]|nr:16S rRNA (uracil(1498)-N(3))-methyltransferase [Candidatus Omnitrophota bacterium]MCM8824158.1 16S rRNA (uracil(1498)-N(3))-methyltransferase [Candidatus Omnitrophota bacterium]MCM8826489.1 16S rRNA (uracil(1498)-N(3))-methyltransferase [Candidatus Omnitrophota bacterium]